MKGHQILRVMLMVASFALILYLAVDCFMNLKFVGTESSSSFTARMKGDLKSIRNIDSLRSIAIKNLDYLNLEWQASEREYGVTEKRFWISIVLLILQALPIYDLLKQKKTKRSNN